MDALYALWYLILRKQQICCCRGKVMLEGKLQQGLPKAHRKFVTYAENLDIQVVLLDQDMWIASISRVIFAVKRHIRLRLVLID
jgi:hypothetical protein